MLKKVFKILVILLMLIGVYFGISITVKKQIPEFETKQKEINIFSKLQTKPVEVTKFYTYGKSFNINGKISNISKDNFEGAKLVIADGLDYENSYNLNYEFSDNDLLFSSDIEINSGVVIDNLEDTDYYILLRLKLNNSAEPKYYSFVNKSEYDDINYYTITSEGKNRLVSIKFIEQSYNNNSYNLLKMSFNDTKLPEDIYDIVIDAGHGGKDTGEVSGSITEADIVLDYAESLKARLDELGYKVKLTRDVNNTDSYTDKNMYDDNGRISIACKSKAKLMISLHINNGANELRGLEIYCPSKSNLDFAKEMASKITEYSNINYSNNKSFKQDEGIYVRNFTKSVINDFVKSANKKGYEPYNITTDTPFLYTIREVGGIATGAYVDGRNKDYSKNQYYNSNQGIECYQIELGYMKNDLEIIVNEKENYIRGIVDAIQNEY